MDKLHMRGIWLFQINRFALKNNSSTLRVNNPSVKTSLVSDMENEASIDRY